MIAFNTHESGQSSGERMRITGDGVLQFSPIGTVPTYNNSIYSYSSNGYMYVQGGTTGLGLAGSGNRNNAIYVNSTDNIIVFHTNNAGERMRINAAGQVTLPYQPAFYAWYNGGNSTRTTGAFTSFTSTRVNRGSHYNTSNGRFTAPIAGVYEFIFSLLWRNDSGDTGAGEISLGVNGSNLNARGMAYSSSPGTNGYHTQTLVRAVLSLSAGDYVTGWIHVSGTSVGNWYYGENLGYFSGYLLG